MKTQSFDNGWGADFSLLILLIPLILNIGRPADLIPFFQQQSSVLNEG